MSLGSFAATREDIIGIERCLTSLHNSGVTFYVNIFFFFLFLVSAVIWLWEEGPAGWRAMGGGGGGGGRGRLRYHI